jgi:hypothetical protein
VLRAKADFSPAVNFIIFIREENLLGVDAIVCSRHRCVVIEDMSIPARSAFLETFCSGL